MVREQYQTTLCSTLHAAIMKRFGNDHSPTVNHSSGLTFQPIIEAVITSTVSRLNLKRFTLHVHMLPFYNPCTIVFITKVLYTHSIRVNSDFLVVWCVICLYIIYRYAYHNTHVPLFMIVKCLRIYSYIRYYVNE